MPSSAYIIGANAYMSMGPTITLNLLGAGPVQSFVWVCTLTLKTKGNKKKTVECKMGLMPQVVLLAAPTTTVVLHMNCLKG